MADDVHPAIRNLSRVLGVPLTEKPRVLVWWLENDENQPPEKPDGRDCEDSRGR